MLKALTQKNDHIHQKEKKGKEEEMFLLIEVDKTEKIRIVYKFWSILSWAWLSCLLGL